MIGKDLKLHDFLTTGKYPIYNGRIALHYYELGKYTARQLETWKHENIKYHLVYRKLNDYKLYQFKNTVNEPSGYCFETSLRERVCKRCRFTKTLKKPCYKIDEYHDLIQSNSFNKFELAHEQWCKKLKNHIWQKHWEEYKREPYQKKEEEEIMDATYPADDIPSNSKN